MRSNSMILLAMIALLGCERFEKAGPVECEALYDHVVDLEMAENDGGNEGGGDDAAVGQLARLAVQSLGRAVRSKLGEKQKYLVKCQTLQTKGDVRTCLKAATMADLKTCGAL